MQPAVTLHAASLARIATTVYFVINGFALGIWVVHIPEIQERTGVDKPMLGNLLLLFGGVALIGMQVGGRLVDRFGSRFPVLLGAAGISIGLLGPALADNVLTLAAALAVLGFFNGGIDVSQNAQAVEVERVYGRPILSGFHAFFSLGGLLAAVLGGALIASGLDIRATLAIAGLLSLTGALASRPSLLRRSRRLTAATAGPKVRPPWNARVLLLGLLAFALMLSEGVAYDWSTVHLHDSLGASKATAAWAFGAFSAALTIVRLLADRLVERVGSATYVQAAAMVGAVGLATAALAPTIWVALAGWTIFGIGLAGCVPQFFSAAGNIDPRNAGTYLARAAGFGYVGLLAGPATIGILTHWVSLPTAFWLPIAGCLAAALLAPKALHRTETSG